MGSPIKRLARRLLRAGGFSVRSVGHGVCGVDLLHDARILLGDTPAPLLFDVGANIGQTTEAMLDGFRSPRIRAFEPSPASFAWLRRRGWPAGVTIEPFAMGDSEGQLPFNATRDFSVNDSLLSPTWNAGGTIHAVQVVTVDGYCERNGIAAIGLLKIDAQGYDLRVLKGARQMLDARRIALYSCEAMFVPMYDGQATLRDLLAFSDEIGYRLVGVYEQTYVGNRLGYVDLLFSAG